MADEKKIALVIQLRADGQGKAQEVTVNLKNLGAAHDGASKKAKDHGSSMVELTRKILGLMSVKEVIKVIKDVSRALVDMVQQAVAFQSEFAPLRQGFEQSASKIKTSFATITSAALPAVIGLMTALGDAFGAVGEFVNQNRELIATNLVKWAVDSGRALVSGLATGASIANKAINGLKMGANLAEQAYYALNAELDEAAAKKSGDSKYADKAREEQRLADLAFAAAAKNVRDMEKFDKDLDDLVTKSGEYLGKAEKVGLEMAKKPVNIIDPDMVAKNAAAADNAIAKLVERVSYFHHFEQNMADLSEIRHKLREEEKLATTNERLWAVQDRLRQTDALESKIRLAESSRAEQQAARQKALAQGVADIRISNLERVAEHEERDHDRRNKLRDRELTDANDKVGRMSAGFEKAQGFMSLITQIESERRTALEKGNIDRAAKLEEDSIQARKSAFAEYYDGVKDVVGGVVDAAKTLIKAGVDGTRDMGQVAIGIAASIGEAVIDRLLGMFVGFISEQIANLLLKGVAQSAIGAAAGAANITANAAVAASAAIAATAAIPILGPALAPAAGAAAFTEAMAYLPIALGSAVAMATGGLVLGGAAGLDSVPAMLMPGEFVVPAAQVRQNVAAGRAPDDSGASGARGGGGAVNINVSQQSFVPGTKADFNRSVREAVLPAIRQLARQGLLVLK